MVLARAFHRCCQATAATRVCMILRRSVVRSSGNMHRKSCRKPTSCLGRRSHHSQRCTGSQRDTRDVCQQCSLASVLHPGGNLLLCTSLPLVALHFGIRQRPTRFSHLALTGDTDNMALLGTLVQFFTTCGAERTLHSTLLPQTPANLASTLSIWLQRCKCG